VIRTKAEWFDAADPIRRICSDKREFTLFYREDGSLVIETVLELTADAGDLEIGPEDVGAWSVCLAPGLTWKKDAVGIFLRNSEGIVDSAVPGWPKPGQRWGRVGWRARRVAAVRIEESAKDRSSDGAEERADEGTGLPWAKVEGHRAGVH
jgi:hypothetical protein